MKILFRKENALKHFALVNLLNKMLPHTKKLYIYRSMPIHNFIAAVKRCTKFLSQDRFNTLSALP